MLGGLMDPVRDFPDLVPIRNRGKTIKSPIRTKRPGTETVFLICIWKRAFSLTDAQFVLLVPNELLLKQWEKVIKIFFKEKKYITVNKEKKTGPMLSFSKAPSMSIHASQTCEKIQLGEHFLKSEIWSNFYVTGFLEMEKLSLLWLLKSSHTLHRKCLTFQAAY